ncbi:hypothetical protein ACFXD5_21645 [Streptomyces sp. NPDC059385]|uniref:hypothetical protein n=1 Tax=Streptomyces sp. NPDC059385 TaxID=3346817 RepID=UPI0036CFD515
MDIDIGIGRSGTLRGRGRVGARIGIRAGIDIGIRIRIRPGRPAIGRGDPRRHRFPQRVPIPGISAGTGAAGTGAAGTGAAGIGVHLGGCF